MKDLLQTAKDKYARLGTPDRELGTDDPGIMEATLIGALAMMALAEQVKIFNERVDTFLVSDRIKVQIDHKTVLPYRAIEEAVRFEAYRAMEAAANLVEEEREWKDRTKENWLKVFLQRLRAHLGIS